MDSDEVKTRVASWRKIASSSIVVLVPVELMFSMKKGQEQDHWKWSYKEASFGMYRVSTLIDEVWQELFN